MPMTDPPSEAEGTLWQGLWDLARFVAEAALVSGGIIVAALLLL